MIITSEKYSIIELWRLKNNFSVRFWDRNVWRKKKKDGQKKKDWDLDMMALNDDVAVFLEAWQHPSGGW